MPEPLSDQSDFDRLEAKFDAREAEFDARMATIKADIARLETVLLTENKSLKALLRRVYPVIGNDALAAEVHKAAFDEDQP